jgi:hypothetical protein
MSLGDWSCPLPKVDLPTITMSHGAGKFFPSIIRARSYWIATIARLLTGIAVTDWQSARMLLW